MQVKVRFLDKLRLEASFDDYTVISDQPIRYKGDATAPGPFDYFLASSAMCAAYFVKAYCLARDIPTEDISITQNNIIDPENRYKQGFKIIAEIPESISDKDRQGIIKSMERCSVKRVIQNSPDFEIEAVSTLGKSSGLLFSTESDKGKSTTILGKDKSLEDTIQEMSGVLSALGINIEISSWRNIVPHIWSVNICDADSPMCFTNGKGATKEAALCSALGEYLERLSNNYFYNDYYLGAEVSNGSFVHYANEKWFKVENGNELPPGLMDKLLINTYSSEEEPLQPIHLLDTNSSRQERGICAVPFKRQSDQKDIYIPVNLIGNLFVSNGMSAGNTKFEARVQSLSEVFERAVKNKIITEQITLPDVPEDVISQYPLIIEGIKKLEEQGFPIIVKDASLGGKFPVLCVTLMNPKTGGVFASFGSHPKFEVALERSLTELMQGRSFEGLNDLPPPTFNEFTVKEPNNIVEHFVDSSGVISWRFFAATSDYEFNHWDLSGNTEQEYNYLMNIFKGIDKEVYIADYSDLGAYACRAIVPGFSEIYPLEDLIWNNNNKGVIFRERCLTVHSLPNNELEQLVSELEQSEFDDYMPMTDFIGIAFDENSPWGKCTIGEFKGLIYLALGKLDEAKQQVEAFNHYNDNIPSRRRFYQLLGIVLDILTEPDLKFGDYKSNLIKMYGEQLVSDAHKSVSGEVKFYGLTPTDMNLTGIYKHSQLVASYKKVILARKAYSLKG